MVPADNTRSTATLTADASQHHYSDDFRALLRSMAEMMESIADDVKQLKLECASSIFPSLEAEIQTTDGAGQPSPLKTEYSEVAHNLFDKMPKPAPIHVKAYNILVVGACESEDKAYKVFDEMSQPHLEESVEAAEQKREMAVDYGVCKGTDNLHQEREIDSETPTMFHGSTEPISTDSQTFPEKFESFSAIEEVEFSHEMTNSARDGTQLTERDTLKVLDNLTKPIQPEVSMLHYYDLQALGAYTVVQAPKVFCICMDSSVIGTPFYIMEFLEGEAICHATTVAMASIHPTVDATVDAINFTTDLMFHPVEAKVVSIRDWELSTLENQLCDVILLAFDPGGRRQIFSLASLFRNEMIADFPLNKVDNQVPYLCIRIRLELNSNGIYKSQGHPVAYKYQNSIPFFQNLCILYMIPNDILLALNTNWDLKLQSSPFIDKGVLQIWHTGSVSSIDDVNFWVDGILTFIFDPGGSYSSQMGCDYSGIQRKIKEQFDQFAKFHQSNCLTMTQVGQSTDCLLEAKKELQHRSEVIQRKFRITKALLMEADRSSLDRLHQQSNRIELEQKRLPEGPRLLFYLSIFPIYIDANFSLFNKSEVFRIRSMFTGWRIPESGVFGPYELLNFTLLYPFCYGLRHFEIFAQIFVWDPGQIVISFYILEDKNVFEGVGKDIVLMDTILEIIMDSKALRKSSVCLLKQNVVEMDLNFFKGSRLVLVNGLILWSMFLVIKEAEPQDCNQTALAGLGPLLQMGPIGVIKVNFQTFVWDPGLDCVSFRFFTLRTRCSLGEGYVMILAFIISFICIFVFSYFTYLARYDVIY